LLIIKLMTKGDTFWGAFHIDLESEIDRIKQELEHMGVQNPTKLEASALIAQRSRNLTMGKEDIKKFIRKKRGIL